MQPALTESVLADSVMMLVQAKSGFSRTPVFMMPVSCKPTLKLIVILKVLVLSILQVGGNVLLRMKFLSIQFRFSSFEILHYWLLHLKDQCMKLFLASSSFPRALLRVIS